jgi:hypothetical protein
MTEIRTPDCPTCGHPPVATFFVPYICSNDECKVMSWDPTHTLAEIRASEPAMIDFDPDDPFQRRET